jgi:FtsH-binding integral membrane protein
MLDMTQPPDRVALSDQLSFQSTEANAMSYVDDNNPYRTWGMVAAQAETNERASFIRQTYAHLLGAVLAFAGIEAVLLNSPIAPRLTQLMLGNGQLGWLVVIAAFIGISYLANYWATSATSVGTQYLGLGLYVVAEAIIFVPLLFIASLSEVGGTNLLANAVMLTAMIFGGLTAIVFMTGADFSFLRSALMVGGIAAMGVIVCSMIFGFNLGIVFIAAMLLFASGYILYDTSNVLHHYRIGQHVAAALALFASVALLFWYVVRLLMSLNRR